MVAVPTLNTYYAGQRWRAADVNSQIRAAQTWGFAAKVCKVQRTTTQSINDSTVTAISFNLDVFDIGAWHDNSTNPERITPDLPGYYQVNGNAGFTSSALGTRRLYIMTQNGATLHAQSGIPGYVATGHVLPICVSALIYLDGATDVQLGVYQNSGGALTTSVTGIGPSTLSVQWVGT